MSTGNWERLRALFDGALERPPHKRGSFLKEHGNGDAARRHDDDVRAAAFPFDAIRVEFTLRAA